jgi:uncharacterized RDD family membrane protein YckC
MQEHTITGEAVVLNLRAANFMPRLGAALLDAVIYFIGWLLLMILVGQYTTMFAMDIAAAQAVAIISMVTLMFLVPLLVEGLSKGRSVGKLAFGLRVVRDDGGTTRWRHTLIRCLTGVFELWMTAGSVAIIASLFNKQSKRLGDMMAGTYVIMARAPKMPHPLPPVPRAMQQWAQVADLGRIPAALAHRINSLIRTAPTMNPYARVQVAGQLYTEVLPYVTPGPPSGVDPYTFLVGVMAERRNRDYQVLAKQRDRRQRDAAYLMQ